MTTESEMEQGASAPLPEEVAPEAKPAESEVPEEVMPAKKNRSWLQKALTWVGVVLLALLVGFGVAFFVLYLPLQRQYVAASTELATLRSDYEKVNSELSALKAEYQRAQEQLSEGQLDWVLSRLVSNVSYLRLALITKDNLTAQQELSAAEANLKALTPLLNDPQTAQALEERLKTIRGAITSNPNKALEELRLLSENLARLKMR